MKFKVGDKVKMLTDPIGGIEIGDICTVYRTDEHSFGVKEYPAAQMAFKCWELVYRVKPITETDYLDAFQQNFKDGI